MKSFVLVLILLTAGLVCGQEGFAPILVDEFGKLSCEDVLARTDNFANQLQSSPKMIGVVLITGPVKQVEDYPAAFMYRAIIGRWGFNLRVKIFRSNSERPWSTQLWLADSYTAVDTENSSLILETPPVIAERFYFGEMTGDPCSNHIGSGFASVLKSNLTYIGHIVVYKVSRKQRPEIAASWLKSMSEDYGIQRRQLRIFFKSNKRDAFIIYNTKFWIVPKRGK